MTGIFQRSKNRLGVNSSRVHLRAFLKDASSHLRREAKVLDAGAGDAAHKAWLPACQYQSTDIKIIDLTDEKVSFLSNLDAIPITNSHYDVVICTQVLEHVRDPLSVLEEIFRILNPGGELWLTVPLYYEEHEVPDDYFRFTRYGLAYLLETAGFKIKELRWLEGYFGTLSYELRKAAKHLPLDPRNFGNLFLGLLLSFLNLFLKPTFLVLSILFTYADLVHRYDASGHPKNYAVIGIKPNLT